MDQGPVGEGFRLLLCLTWLQSELVSLPIAIQAFDSLQY